MEFVLSASKLNGVPGIGASAVTDDGIGFLAEDVNKLAFGLITPVCPDHYHCTHLRLLGWLTT